MKENSIQEIQNRIKKYENRIKFLNDSKQKIIDHLIEFAKTTSEMKKDLVQIFKEGADSIGEGLKNLRNTINREEINDEKLEEVDSCISELNDFSLEQQINYHKIDDTLEKRIKEIQEETEKEIMNEIDCLLDLILEAQSQLSTLDLKGDIS